ncbi:hypothetical protein SB751_28385, partial [Cupriavidus sp. SIMBA_020]
VLVHDEPGRAAQYFFRERSLIRKTIQQANFTPDDIQRVPPQSGRACLAQQPQLTIANRRC